MGCIFTGLLSATNSPDACEGVSMAQQGQLLGQQRCLCRHSMYVEEIGLCVLPNFPPSCSLRDVEAVSGHGCKHLTW